MNFLEIAKIVSALLNVGFGVYTVFEPEKIAAASHYDGDNPRGRSEMRVIGGLFIGLGVGALMLGSVFQNEDTAYQVLGFAWLGAAITRAINLFLEDRTQIIDTTFWLLLAIEFFPGMILVAPN
jgi:hypothetical protein